MLKEWGHDKAGDYVAFIWRAVMQPELFATFRADPRYRAVVETLWPETGAQYLELIADAAVRRLCLESEAADAVGGPVRHAYEGAMLAPTTLRYGKVLADLVRLFPHFAAIEAMVEIGIGHGGQARIIAEYAARTPTALKDYTLLDLLPVLHLARGYLEHFALRPRFRYRSKSELAADARWGLAVSNYAFSELARPLQEEYLTRVLLRAEAGYLTMNSGLWRGEWRGQPCLEAETLLARLPNAALLFEEPLTAPDNYLLVFGRHGAGPGLGLAELRSRARERAAAPARPDKRRGLFARG